MTAEQEKDLRDTVEPPVWASGTYGKDMARRMAGDLKVAQVKLAECMAENVKLKADVERLDGCLAKLQDQLAAQDASMREATKAMDAGLAAQKKEAEHIKELRERAERAEAELLALKSESVDTMTGVMMQISEDNRRATNQREAARLYASGEKKTITEWMRWVRFETEIEPLKALSPSLPEVLFRVEQCVGSSEWVQVIEGSDLNKARERLVSEFPMRVIERVTHSRLVVMNEAAAARSVFLPKPPITMAAVQQHVAEGYCEFCGRTCHHGAAHNDNARVEDGVNWNDPQPTSEE